MTWERFDEERELRMARYRARVLDRERDALEDGGCERAGRFGSACRKCGHPLRADPDWRPGLAIRGVVLRRRESPDLRCPRHVDEVVDLDAVMLAVFGRIYEEVENARGEPV